MKIQIHLPDPKYLPFFLYANSLKACIEKDINPDVEIIQALGKVNVKDPENIVFVFLIHVTQDLLIQANVGKVVMINTEQYTSPGFSARMNFVLSQATQKQNWSMLEYNPKNMKYYRQKYPNFPLFYLPLLYSEFLETYYNSLVPERIPYEEKDIDIFFSGSLNPRRIKLLNFLQTKYRVKIVDFREQLDHKELFQYMERSKLVLNVFYYDVFAFDFYRNALLISNKIPLLSEFPRDVDLDIEPNLKGFGNSLLLEKYEFIPETIAKILKHSGPEIINAVDIGYEWFKRNDMSMRLIEFLGILNTSFPTSIPQNKSSPRTRFALF
jgi:hypothetical protein